MEYRVFYVYILILILSLHSLFALHASLLIFIIINSVILLDRRLMKFTKNVWLFLLIMSYLTSVLYFVTSGYSDKIIAAVIIMPALFFGLTTCDNWKQRLAVFGCSCAAFYIIAGNNFSRSLLLLLPLLFINIKISLFRLIAIIICVALMPILMSHFVVVFLQETGWFYVYDFGRFYYLTEHLRIFVEKFPYSLGGLNYEYYLSNIQPKNGWPINSPHLFFLEVFFYYGPIFYLIFFLFLFEIFYYNPYLLILNIFYLFFNPITDMTMVILQISILIHVWCVKSGDMHYAN